MTAVPRTNKRFHRYTALRYGVLICGVLAIICAYAHPNNDSVAWNPRLFNGLVNGSCTIVAAWIFWTCWYKFETFENAFDPKHRTSTLCHCTVATLFIALPGLLTFRSACSGIL